jgi:hypothetical protein
MSDWLHSLSIAGIALVVFGATSLVASAIYGSVMLLARGERGRVFQALSPGMLPPLGILFGLFVAFLSAQVWGDRDRAHAAVNHEASALRAVALLVASFPGEPEARMHALLRRHIEAAVTQEWPSMARRRATLAVVSAPLAEALRLSLSLTPRGDGQVIAQREIVTALQDALDARRQRILISRSTVDWVKWAGLILQAICTLLAIAMVHSSDRATAAVAIALFATGVAVSMLLIASHDQPFTGEIAVGPDLLRQVMPEALMPAPPPNSLPNP